MSLNVKAVWNKPYRKKNKKDLISLVKITGDKILNNNFKRNNVHIVYLLDSSGSMGSPISHDYKEVNNLHFARNIREFSGVKTKLDQVKDAVIESISLLSEEDFFSVMKFSSEAEYVFETQKATAENKKLAISKISQIRAGGDTQMYKGFKAGLHELKNYNGKKELTKRLFLLTDGEATDRVEYEKFYNIAKTLSDDKNPITISTFGVGDSFKEDFLLELSLSGSGSFYFLESKVSFSEVFLRELGELQSLLFKNMKLSIKGIEMTDVVMLNDFKKDENDCYILPNLISGREIVFALKGNAIGKSSRIDLSFNYKDIKDVNGSQVIEFISIPVDISSENYINKEVEDFSLKIEIAQKQKEAAEQLRRNDKESAQRTMLMALSISSGMNNVDLEVTKNINDVINNINSGDLKLAAKSSLNSSYSTFYSRDKI